MFYVAISAAVVGWPMSKIAGACTGCAAVGRCDGDFPGGRGAAPLDCAASGVVPKAPVAAVKPMPPITRS